jgi:hypothetical protein
MTEQSPSAIGTVAQEAARLIDDMATMARSTYSRGDDPSPHAGEPAQEPVSLDVPDAPHAAPSAGGDEAADESAADVCSECGAERDHTPGGGTSRDGTPSSCRLCPLCRGIALLRSVRPETVDLLADLAVAVAASLRDVAARSRASDSTSSARSTSGDPPGAERVSVQNIPVDDEREG